MLPQSIHLSLLAQDDTSGISSIIVWSGILFGIIIAAFFAYSQLKRWMSDDEQPAAMGFTLADLRDLHRQGKMTDAEYELARGKMVASAKAMTDKMPAVLEGRKQRTVSPGEAGDVQPGGDEGNLR